MGMEVGTVRDLGYSCLCPVSMGMGMEVGTVRDLGYSCMYQWVWR